MIIEKIVKTGRSLFIKKRIYVPNEIEGSAAEKMEKRNALCVSHNGMRFNADPESINFISTRIALANAEYNRIYSSGTSRADTYSQVFETTIKWKLANNKVVDIEVKDLVVVLDKAMNMVERINSVE